MPWYHRDMDFELAKELKDAGFPQKSRGLHYTMTEGKEVPYLAEGNLFLAKEGWQYSDTFVPTLDELIEACGQGRFTLDHLESGCWEACHSKATPMCYQANTSDEAVARLWLVLNQKQ